MEETITIRTAHYGDIDDVLRLWVEACVEPSATDDAGGVKRLLDADPDSLLLAVIGDEIVGSVIAVFDGWRGNLYRLAVHPTWRRRGIAQRLITGGELHLRSLGARRVTALVLAQREAAVGLWQSAGYKPDPRVQRSAKNLTEDA